MKREIPVSESDLVGILGDNIIVDFRDKIAAQDVRRVMRAMTPPVRVGVRGKSVIVPAKSLGIVRKYLRGEINPSEYRRNMPADYYGEKPSIYERQLAYV